GLEKPSVFTGIWHFLGQLFCLFALPMLAYPAQRLLKALHHDAARRYVAMVFAVTGYVFSRLFNQLAGAGKEAWLISLEYLLGGAMIFFLNWAAHVSVSGHTCGIAGPVLLMAVNGLAWAWPVGAGILLAVGIASLKTRMHSLLQMFAGCGIPFVVYWPLSLCLA
ncbi:MAG: hypothetical protein IJ174_06120, partial [Clostridia bacterium]|nr:hypothetical protein [Clostridia bacterium]